MDPIRVIRSKTVVMPSTNIDTDQIIPARFLTTTTREGLGAALFADLRNGPDGQPRPDFVLNRPESRGCQVLVAGRNIGCGSSREHAPMAIKGAGVSLVIAKSFARIFYRNAFNMGLPILECPEAFDSLNEGDEVSVFLQNGEITISKNGRKLKAQPVPEFMQSLLNAGGLMNYVKKKAGLVK